MSGKALFDLGRGGKRVSSSPGDCLLSTASLCLFSSLSGDVAIVRGLVGLTHTLIACGGKMRHTILFEPVI